jgi:hypothetical protein
VSGEMITVLANFLMFVTSHAKEFLFCGLVFLFAYSGVLSLSWMLMVSGFLVRFEISSSLL